MAPKKKVAKNGFYFFMLEIQRREAEKGSRCTLAAASAIGNPLWRAMDPEERKKYNDMAAAASSKAADDLTKKFTSLGVSYATIDAEQREKDEFMNIMLATIKSTVHNLNHETTLKTFKFFVCHVNYYYYTEDNYHAPAEFALAVFNLEKGLIDYLHFFIDAGKIPLGLKYHVQDWSNRTHQIPFNDPTWNHFSHDFYELYQKVQNFISRHKNGNELPPIYTMYDSQNTNYSHTAVNCALEKICETANMDPALFKVYNIAILFFELRNKCSPAPIPSVAIMKSEIERDVFSYAKNLGCFFHEEKDLSLYCSLSMVVRWIFTICDHCCRHLHIDLKLGKHIPKESNVSFQGKANIANSLTCERDDSVNRTTLPDKPLTIIDHGHLKETRLEEKLKQDAIYQQCESLRLPKTSYSDKIGARFNRDAANVSSSSARASTSLRGNSRGAAASDTQDFDAENSDGSEWSTVRGRGGFGKGRATNRKNPRSGEHILPVSGRGRLAAMNYE